MVVETKPTYKVIGTRPLRPDGADKVTGRARYGADIKLTGQLEGAVLRSPHAHARIKRIDTSKAAALPGVKAILTGADMPLAADRIEEVGEGTANLRDLSNNVMATDKALYRGHAVAAVAATSRHIAQEAIRLIEVEYEVLPPVLNVRDGMRADAPLLHERMRTRELGVVNKDAAPSNVAVHNQFIQGDPDAGFAAADVIIEREFTTSMVHQGYVELHASTGLWNTDGQITIWTSTQGPFPVRAQCSEILRQPVSKIKVVPMEIGGGFGGKIPAYLDPVAALLSRKAGHKPVRIIMERDAIFEATGPASGTYIKLKIGAKRDGTLTAAEGYLAYETGAYPGWGAGPAMNCIIGPYNIANVKLDGYDVVVNKPKTAAYRAPSVPPAAFAAEQVIDELAETLGIDPLTLRQKNAAREGVRQASGQAFRKIGCEEVAAAAAATPHWNAPLEGPNRGRGLAFGHWANAGMKSSVTGSILPDGTVSFIEGSVDIGGSRASLAMQLAETLGVPYSDIKPQVADTDSVGYNDVTAGSRTTYATGQAAYELGLDLIRKMKERAAKIWEAPVEDVAYEAGVLSRLSDASKTMTFKELAGKILHTGAPITGEGNVNATLPGGAFAAHIVDVEVDPDTGKVTILRYTAVQDVGTAIHPSYVEGQIQGGVAQGIGWALNEEYYYDDSGRMANSSYLDYRVPTTLDLPMIEPVIVEVANPDHPFGVRGVGEVPIVPPLAALANAIYRATGHRFRDLPMSPRRITEELHGLA